MILERLADIVGKAAAGREIGTARKAPALAGEQEAACTLPRRRCHGGALSALSDCGRASAIVVTAAGLCSTRIC